MHREHHAKQSIIFLTGFMGSGKSTVGPILANTLGFEFMDLDAVLEHRENMKITEIFKQFGEARFRDMERAAVHEFSADRRLVVALGGGTVVHQPTLDEILHKGVLVYLQSTASFIFQRLRTKTNRPLLLQTDGSPMGAEQLLHHIEGLLAARAPYYEQAPITVCIDNRRVGQTVDTIVKELRGYVNF